MKYNSMNYWGILVALIVSSSTACVAQLKVVCIGNSITQGKIGLKSDSSYEYSYRPWLWEKLLRTGFNVDMVGFHPYFFDERNDNMMPGFESGGVSFDRDCEAYYGITSSQFVRGTTSTGWTGTPLPDFRKRINDPQRGYTPHIALIHIGTNDPDSTNQLVKDTRDNIVEIIRVLRQRNPSITVFVAKLITGWKKINNEVEEMCREVNTGQSRVVAVDMATGFINDPKLNGTMTYDYVHPNKAGQLFMMERWYNGIVENIRDTEAPVLAGRPVLTDKSSDRVAFSWPAATDNFGIKSYQIIVDGEVVAEISPHVLSYRINDARKRHVFKVSIKAKDWGGNFSNEITAAFKVKRIMKANRKNLNFRPHNSFCHFILLVRFNHENRLPFFKGL
jgi:lysophospholipase L1-like esterase